MSFEPFRGWSSKQKTVWQKEHGLSNGGLREVSGSFERDGFADAACSAVPFLFCLDLQMSRNKCSRCKLLVLQKSARAANEKQKQVQFSKVRSCALFCARVRNFALEVRPWKNARDTQETARFTKTARFSRKCSILKKVLRNAGWALISARLKT